MAIENRIEAGLKEWRNYEKRLMDLFGEAFTKHANFHKAQLEHFREVLQRPLPNITTDEKMIRQILKVEIRRMEKVLYPSGMVRFVRRIGRIGASGHKNESITPAVITIQAPFLKQPQAVLNRETVSRKLPDKREMGNKQQLIQKRNKESGNMKRRI